MLDPNAIIPANNVPVQKRGHPHPMEQDTMGILQLSTSDVLSLPLRPASPKHDSDLSSALFQPQLN
jgi:hypothetical protein